MKNSKQKFFGSNILICTNRVTRLTIAIKLCGNHIKVATALAGANEEFKHSKGIKFAFECLNNGKCAVFPINHKGLGVSKQRRLSVLMNNFDSYFTDVFRKP
jgi:hypothetical protein